MSHGSWPGDGFYGLAPTLAPPLAPTGVVRVFREIRFYLHRDFCGAEIGILSTQRIGGGDLEEKGDSLQVKRVVP